MANQIPNVDEWLEAPEDIIFTNAKNIIMAPVSKFYHVDPEDKNLMQIDFFMVNSKKSYNSDDLRIHTCKYLNYFEKYFDQDKEYFTNLAHIKFFIDCFAEYTKENLIYDISRYILQKSLLDKTRAMTDYNYSLTLSYKSSTNPQLQYTDEHAKALIQMSILMNMCIPLITHFAYRRRVQNIDEFLLDFYDYILYCPYFNGIDIYSKLYETSFSNVSKNEKNNAGVWCKQDIRGKDTVTHSMAAVRNIILNIMPKYTFDKSIVSLNYTSIQKHNKFQITDIAYEFSYIPLSSSRRDTEDSVSDMDKYEANLIKSSEADYLQTKVNAEIVLKKIDQQWGPFNEDEIRFYLESLRNEKGEIMNGFQRQLIYNLFYKYFGDTTSIRIIRDGVAYVKLMITAKRMLKNNMMRYLPYIIGGKVEKIVTRKTLNKKELMRMQASPYYPLVKEKYKNEKIEKQILSTIATIITSTFTIIDYEDRELHGKQILIEPDTLIDECLIYVLLI